MVVLELRARLVALGREELEAEQRTFPLEQPANSHLSSVPYHVLAGQAESIAAIFSSSLGTTTGLLPNDGSDRCSIGSFQLARVIAVDVIGIF